MYRVGIDIGGTITDFVAIDPGANICLAKFHWTARALIPLAQADFASACCSMAKNVMLLIV